jgi:hypothetical protein
MAYDNTTCLELLGSAGVFFLEEEIMNKSPVTELLRRAEVETVGLHHEGSDYVIICIPKTKNAHSAIPIRLSEIPADLSEKVKKDGLRFFADVKIEYDDTVPGGELFSFSNIELAENGS